MATPRRSCGPRARLDGFGWRKLAAGAAVFYLVLFQVFAAAHASAPEALSPDHGVCVLCAAASRADDAAAPDFAVAEPAFESFESPVESAPALIARQEGADPPARAPPIL